VTLIRIWTQNRIIKTALPFLAPISEGGTKDGAIKIAENLMGMKVICLDEFAVLPRPCALELSCDVEGGLFLFPTTTARFASPEGFIVQHRDAMAAGWLERDGGARGRIWVCPECSGKKGK
jgi:hypothetical protein